MTDKKRQIYQQGYNDGAKASSDADFRIQLCKVLMNTKGIGEKLLYRVMETAKEMEKNDKGK